VYSMLIVEDERWEREGLVDFLDWNAMGVAVAGTAVDGIDGYEKALEYRPDIIVTDIRMPGMNGLEMVRKIRASLPDVRVVFLTGYSDFEYTRKAISLNVDDYVLKPVEEADMRSAMLRVIEKCDRIRARRVEEEAMLQKLRSGERMALEKLLHDLLHERGQPEQLARLLLDREARLRSAAIGVMVVVSAEPVREETVASLVGASCYMVGCDALPGAMTIVLPATKGAAANEVRHAAERLIAGWKGISRATLTIGFGEPADALEQAGRAYRIALNAARYGVFYGMSGIVTSEMWEEERKRFAGQSFAFLSAWQEASRQVRLHVLALQEKAVRQQLEDMFASIRNHPGAGKNYVAALLNGLIIDLSMIEDGHGRDEGRIQEFLLMDRLDEMCAYVREYIGALLERIESKRVHKDDYIVEKTIRLIEDKLGSRELSLTVLAEEVFVSPNYLGMLFKNATGKTVHQFITETRLHKAEELLRTNKLKVSEVAERIGMTNISYFCSLFKQHYGISPGEYKELMLRR